jgi:molecular chaperone GrpE (heat shock protein)
MSDLHDDRPRRFHSGTRNAAEREKASSALAATAEEREQMIIELEDELQRVEDAKLRLEADMRALKERAEHLSIWVYMRKSLQRDSGR